MQLEAMLRPYPICVVADPTITSMNDLPKVDFVESDLRIKEKRRKIFLSKSNVEARMLNKGII